MPKLKLTRSSIKSIVPSSKVEIWWDEAQTGFGVRVQPSGAMAYVSAFRLKGSSQLKFVTIGKVDSFTPEQARDRARDLITAARSGQDLDAEARESVRAQEEGKRVKASQLSVSEAAKRYLRHLETEPSERTGRARSATTIRCTGAWLAGFVKTFGDRELASVEATDIRRIISEAQSASRRNVSGTLKRMMAWALESGYLTSDPSLAVKRSNPPIARERTPSVEEVQKILQACDDLFREGALQRVQLVALKTIVFTGQRRGDIASMEWQDVDLAQAIWTQPHSKNKSRRVHSVPLSSSVLQLLKQHHETSGKPSSGLLFPGVASGRRTDAWMHDASERLRERSGVSFMLHDLRRSIVSVLADNGVSFETADAILNHATSQSRSGLMAVYQRSELTTQKRRALGLWDRLLTGASSDVITLPTAAERRSAS